MNRTPDLRITNALLYQLSYTGFGGVVAVNYIRTRNSLVTQLFDQQALRSP
jgi:hypothetical protein